MMDQENARNLFNVFASSQETFEEAKKKSSEESSKRASFFRFAKDGTYTVRILPLAPVIDKDGNVLPMERKGYEYPLRSLMLKIEDNKKLVKGKPTINYVTVCNAKYAFPNIEADLIDTYVNTACEQYADDEKLCKKLREGSFSGGLKWDSRRCMYIINLDNPGDGIQILQLSYPQYKDLEERKLNLWAKLSKNGQNVPCPISSINAAYPVEIIRKSGENNKPSYSFNIDTVADQHVLEEDTLQKLLDTPRLPEQIYRYTRYHLEATIVFLTQLDEMFGIDVMSSEPIKDCIEQIKTLLPANDQSHFTLGGKNGDNKEDDSNDLDTLWNRLNALYDADLDEQTTEGQELRQSILAFIDANNLDVAISRRMTNEDILREIDKEMGYDNDGEEAKGDDELDEKTQAPTQNENDDDDAEPAVPEADNEPEESPAPRHRDRNDDTNEPAARAGRRGSRVPRRRS